MHDQVVGRVSTIPPQNQLPAHGRHVDSWAEKVGGGVVQLPSCLYAEPACARHEQGGWEG